ncbi:MAG TPA: hypothetical protein VJ853_00965 [Thermoanaerobaculia bacterium]|nr:hypothetical protein [Thermoanaerobaculia bacterium]
MKVEVPVRIGGENAVLIDLSECDARIRHSSPLAAGSETSLVFDWGDAWFIATARIVATNTTESELQFVNVPPNARETLDAALNALKDDRLQQSVRNVVDEALASALPDCEPLRYRWIGGKWIVRTAKASEQQPVDGFIVPSSLPRPEVKRLCAAYETLDNDGRQMLRLVAAARLAA